MFTGLATKFCYSSVACFLSYFLVRICLLRLACTYSFLRRIDSTLHLDLTYDHDAGLVGLLVWVKRGIP